MQLRFEIVHGGQLVLKDGVLVYEGGTIDESKKFNLDCVSRLELLWAIWGLGYCECSPIYYKAVDGKFYELATDRDVVNYASCMTGIGLVLIYVDSPYDKLALWKRVARSDLGAHLKRGSVDAVDKMVINRRPTEKGEALTRKKNIVYPLNSGGICSSDSGSEWEESGSEIEPGNEGEHSDSEEIQSSDEGFQDDGSDEDPEFSAVLKGINKSRQEKSRSKKDEKKANSVKFGPVGVDRGLESYFRSENSYNGLLAGDEGYIDSSDVDSFASDSENEDEEETPRRRRSNTVHYDPSCEVPLFELGMVFNSVYEFRNVVKNYSVNRGVETNYQQNENHRVRVKCSYISKEGHKCPWLLYASLDKQSGNFIVKNYHPVHECERQNKISHCDAKYIAKYLKQDIIDNPGIKISTMQSKLQHQLKVYKSKNCCRKARSIVLQELMGDYKAEYARLYDYRALILESNPGSTCVLDVGKVGDPTRYVFKGIYVCFAAMKKGYERGCRRCIGLDGCFLKGVVKGQLLSATAKNANNEIYPLAWAVVHNETTESWSWFCDLLRDDLHLQEGQGLTIVTDMQKGLENAIQSVLPRAEHRECARHILANWCKKWRGVERRKQFWKCAKSSFEAQLRDNLDELKKLGPRAMYDDLIRYNVERWCRNFFSFDSCCDTVDNNFSETFNSWIVEARSKSIISMLEEIREKIMIRHTKQISFPNTWITDISPMAYKVIEKNSERAMKCNLLWSGDDGFQVSEGPYRHVVYLEKRSCTCRSWMLKGIPCPHAIRAIHSKGLNPVNFVDKWFHRDTFLATYNDHVKPMPNLHMLPPSSNPPIEPPELKPMPGRPKRNRRKPKDELKKFGKLSKNGVHMTCSYCKQRDHNKAGCELRKATEKAQKNATIGASSSQDAKAAPSSSAARKRQARVKGQTAKKAKITSNTPTAGCGLLISDRTGMQRENPKLNQVISTAPSALKSSAVVTGDLDIRPKRPKWRGKEVLTQSDLVHNSAKQQAVSRNKAVLLRESQSQSLPPMKEQRMRADANKARAERILAQSNNGTRSTIGLHSASQPAANQLWKY